MKNTTLVEYFPGRGCRAIFKDAPQNRIVSSMPSDSQTQESGQHWIVLPAEKVSPNAAATGEKWALQ